MKLSILALCSALLIADGACAPRVRFETANGGPGVEQLLAEVGGNEVTNHFEVTEVYVPVGGAWKLASLSFTRLLRQA